MNVLVNNIPDEMESAELRQMFECFGEVVSHRIMIDMRTGRRRDFGFVMFRRGDDALRAVAALDGFEAYGGRLQVRVAQPSTRQPGEPTNRVTMRYIPASIPESTIIALVTHAGARVLHIEHRSDIHAGLVLYLVTVGSVEEALQAVEHLHRRYDLTQNASVPRRQQKRLSVKVASRDFVLPPPGHRATDCGDSSNNRTPQPPLKQVASECNTTTAPQCTFRAPVGGGGGGGGGQSE